MYACAAGLGPCSRIRCSPKLLFLPCNLDLRQGYMSYEPPAFALQYIAQADCSIAGLAIPIFDSCARLVNQAHHSLARSLVL